MQNLFNPTFISIISFLISISSFIFVLYDRFWSQKAHIKINSIFQTNFNKSNCFILLITITNNSSYPVGIYDAKLNNQNVIRRNNRHEVKLINNNSHITKEYSSFPINIAPKETVDILLDFSPCNPLDKNKLILNLSRFPYKKKVKFKTDFLDQEMFSKKISNIKNI